MFWLSICREEIRVFFRLEWLSLVALDIVAACKEATPTSGVDTATFSEAVSHLVAVDDVVAFHRNNTVSFS